MSTVLVADDDRVFVEWLSTRLRAEGYTIITAFDSTQALMMTMRSNPDALIVDVKMPGGTGVETLKRIKRSTRTSHIPVIVASGLDDPALPHLARAAGAVEFLAKPVEFARVLQTLREVMGHAVPSSMTAVGLRLAV